MSQIMTAGRNRATSKPLCRSGPIDFSKQQAITYNGGMIRCLQESTITGIDLFDLIFIIYHNISD